MHQLLRDTVISCDVAVIGGGPAGMMAALRAAERSKRVVLIEKNASLGKKLLITGGGRCNITNAEFDDRALLAKFRDKGKYLFSAFSQWSVKESIEFFNGRGVPTKIEKEQRVFPQSDSARSVWEALVNSLAAGKVQVISNAPATGFETAADAQMQTRAQTKAPNSRAITALILKDGRRVIAASYILATGGMSRPETGSTGDGFAWLAKLGHAVAEPSAALVPITTDDAWVKRLQGVTLADIRISLFLDGEKQRIGSARRGVPAVAGKILFTHFGASGPTILNMSSQIRELMPYGDVEVSIDLLPSHDYATLNETLQEVFKTEINKKFKNSLGSLLPAALVPVIVERSGIDPDTFCHSVTREERLALVKLLKDLRFRPSGFLGTEKAIITSGGVSLDEIDFKTMRSKISPNLFIVGDLLDIDRPSGGYSLQLCWTTGRVAGDNA